MWFYNTLVLLILVANCACDEGEGKETPAESNETATASTESAPHNGFGESIRWYTHDEGLKEIKTRNRMMMLIFHQQWCGACKELKRSLAESDLFVAISQDFVMVNVEGDLPDHAAKYSLGGVYYPRIYFLDPEGNVMENAYNKHGNQKYKYYYSSAEQVTEGMYLAMYPNYKSDKFESKKGHGEL